MKTKHIVLLGLLGLLSLPGRVEAKEKQRLPLDPRLVAAQYVFIENKTGDLEVTDSIYRELLRWGRLKVVISREKADVVLQINHTAPITTGAVYSGKSETNPRDVTSSSGSVGYTVLRKNYVTIVDRATGDVLWEDVLGRAGWSEGRRLLKNLEQRLAKKER